MLALLALDPGQELSGLGGAAVGVAPSPRSAQTPQSLPEPPVASYHGGRELGHAAECLRRSHALARLGHVHLCERLVELHRGLQSWLVRLRGQGQGQAWAELQAASPRGHRPSCPPSRDEEGR